MTRLDARLTRLETTAPRGAASASACITLADWQTWRAASDQERAALLTGPRGVTWARWLAVADGRRAAAREAEELAGVI